MLTITIDGKYFDSLEGFYNALMPYLIDGECPWGENLDSLDEIVFSNFNYTGDTKKDVTKIVWRNFSKSEIDLSVPYNNGETVIEILEDVFARNSSIQVVKI